MSSTTYQANYIKDLVAKINALEEQRLINTDANYRAARKAALNLSFFAAMRERQRLNVEFDIFMNEHRKRLKELQQLADLTVNADGIIELTHEHAWILSYDLNR